MLTNQQLDDFDRDGYIVCENVLDANTVIKPIVSEYSALLKALTEHWVETGVLEATDDNQPFNFANAIRHAYSAGLDYFQPLDISLPPGQITNEIPFHAGPAIFDLMTNTRLLDLVESLIGSEITSNPIQHVRLKPPAEELVGDEIRPHITATGWHQDRAVTLEEADKTRMVTIWAAITDATVENGCLQVIPGSHKGNMLQHCPLPQLAIPEALFDVSQARPIPVSVGSVIIFHPLTVHGSLENTTNDIRWSFDLRYNVTGDPTGRPFFPEFVARSANDPKSELRCAKTWKNLWLDARQTLSTAESVEIHRWDGSSVSCA